MSLTRRFHLSLRCTDMQATVDDYSIRLGARPILFIPDQLALWRTPELNICVRQAAVAELQQLGWEVPESRDLASEIDCNGLEWVTFSLQQQAEGIRKAWPALNIELTPAYSIQDLRYLMSRLRDVADGCPWDLKQSFDTVLPHTLEETYELAEAIERKDWPHVAEELGDYIFQAMFYCRLGEEQGYFVWEDVIGGIMRKLLRRHPHVFPEGQLGSRRPAGSTVDPAMIRGNWQRIKMEEKAQGLSGASSDRHVSAESGRSTLLSEVSTGLPALQRAAQLQRKAAEVGFDWAELMPVFEKLQEEIQELGAEILADGSDQLSVVERESRVTDELGDVLFCCVNLARFLKVEPEAALRHANQKFISRFNFIEQALEQKGVSRERWLAGEVSVDIMERLWDEAKHDRL